MKYLAILMTTMLLSGCYSIIQPPVYARAVKLCAPNEGLKQIKIRVDVDWITITCNNTAEFGFDSYSIKED